jgi:hypothetical protein
LVAIYHPDNYDPSVETEEMSRDIDTLNEEMVAAGVRVFVGGLSPTSSARSLRAQPNGKVLVTDKVRDFAELVVVAVFVAAVFADTAMLLGVPAFH